MEHFGHKDGYGVMCIEALEVELDFGTNKWLQVISNIMLYKNYTNKELKNRSILTF